MRVGSEKYPASHDADELWLFLQLMCCSFLRLVVPSGAKAAFAALQLLQWDLGYPQGKLADGLGNAVTDLDVESTLAMIDKDNFYFAAVIGINCAG